MLLWPVQQQGQVADNQTVEEIKPVTPLRCAGIGELNELGCNIVAE
jgi:hypothetical protein